MVKPSFVKISFTVEGIGEYQQALGDVNDAFENFKEAAQWLQDSTKKLNSVEMKVTNE